MKNLWKHLFGASSEDTTGQLVQIYGRREVYMEGCKQVLHCDENRICVRGRFLTTVEGEGLILKEMGDEVLCARGRIVTVRLEE